jgi:hypothetical protein
VSGQASVWSEGQPRRVNTRLATLPDEGWRRRSAGEGTTGPRWYDGYGLPLAEPLEPGGRRWLVVRRRGSAPKEVTASVVFAPQATPLETLVQVAGSRWTIESSVEAAQGEVGLDAYEVRRWTGGSRHMTLAMWAYARLALLRAGAIAVEACQKTSPGSPAGEPPGRLQSRTWPASLLSVQEMRWLLWRVVLAVQQTAHDILAWSHWRRRHQARAKHDHDTRRDAEAEALAASSLNYHCNTKQGFRRGCKGDRRHISSG